MAANMPGPQSSRPMVGAPQSRRFRSLRWLFGLSILGRAFLFLGALIVLLCLYFAEENWRGRRAWENCRRELQARGVELDWQKFIPPPVPDDQNFAMTPFLAPLFDFNPKPRETPWRDTEGHDRAANFAAVLLPTDKSGQLPPVRFEGKMTDLEEPLSLLRKESNTSSASTAQVFSNRTEAAAALLAAVQPYQPVLDELRTASQRPYSRFNIEYDADDPFSILLPHYLVLHHVTRLLEIRASAELELGKAEAAFADVKFMFYLANAAEKEPFLMGVISRSSLLERTEQIIWEGLAAHRWSESQLAELQSVLTRFALLKDLSFCLGAERAAFGEGAFRYMRSHKNALRNWAASENAPISYLLAGPQGWLYQEQVHYHCLYDQRVLPGYDAQTGLLHPHVIDENRRALERTLSSNSLWHHVGFSRLMLRTMPKLFQRAAIGQTRLDQIIVACGLERYRQENGNYPEKLDSLSPLFIDKVPLDICDGQPLRYRLLPNGQFLLYGVGWNEKDDGGVVVMNKDESDTDPERGDWVWPAYPLK
ncbi:MAG: hypothetical protein QOJ40_708 [Verrucomicrobiota bacterium]